MNRVSIRVDDYVSRSLPSAHDSDGYRSRIPSGRSFLTVGPSADDVGNEFCVEGIPHHKRQLPIGDENNPMPLIEFQQPRVDAPRRSLTKEQRKHRQKLLAKKLSERSDNRRKTA